MDGIEGMNLWGTASCIGYYSTDREKIKLEYFVRGDGGHYQIREGIIKKDTTILSETFNLLFEKEIRSDTLIKSLSALK